MKPMVWIMLLGWASLTGCVNPLPKVAGGVDRHDPDAWTLIEESAEAHGGSVAFAEVRDVAVRYDGTWLNGIWKLQPQLVDRGYRGSSEERLLLTGPTSPVVAQYHAGPEGFKRVVRAGGRTDVTYEARDGEPPWTGKGQPGRAGEAAAMVADAYRMFLTGPFFFLQHPGPPDARAAEPDTVDGVLCDQVLVRLRPGLGVAAEDRVLLSIGRDDRRLRRVRFSLNGFSKTRGATADVTLSEHVERAGLWWPTAYLETVRFPIDREVHRWALTGLDVNRGLTVDDLRGRPSERARRPARSLTR